MNDELLNIADQIEREHNVSDREEHDAAAWVREHGGLDRVRAEWRSRVPHDLYERRRRRLLGHIAECETALGRRNHRIEKLGKTIEFFQLNNSNFRHLLADVAERLGFTRFGDDYEPEDLLDALDRRLMPEGIEWPRYEDGGPVRIGGEFMGKDGKTYTAKQIQFIGKCFSLFDFCDRKPQFSGFYGERVRRPAVLAADGKRIEPAMDVWWICEGDERGIHAEMLRVDGIDDDGMVECSPYNGGTSVVLDPAELYVKKPVPDFGDFERIEIDGQWYVPERTAAVEVSHGTHGPLPRFPGDAWTMHHVCSACGGAVDGGDHYCKHCGARLADNHEKE